MLAYVFPQPLRLGPLIMLKINTNYEPQFKACLYNDLVGADALNVLIVILFVRMG